MAAYPGGSNTYVPSFEASGVIVLYAKDPKKFKINQYTGERKVEKDQGKYLVINSDEAVRVVNTQDTLWADGNDQPRGFANTSAHTFSDYSCERHAYDFAIGDKAVQQAAWDILAAHAALAMSRAMVERTVRAFNILATQATWGANTDTATNLGGGLWGSASTSNEYIKKTLLNACETIQQSTNGVVGPENLSLVITPEIARQIATSDEIISYTKSSPFVMQFLQGERELAENFGVPKQLYGINVIVEDAVRVTSKKGAASRTQGYVASSNSAWLVAKVDDLVSGFGSPFNTLQRFVYEDLTVESMHDQNNRRTDGRIVTDDAYVLTAPASGFYIRNVIS